MSAAKIRKGDKVVVLSGRDKGKTGEVKEALPREGRVIVEGVNLRWRHKKPTQKNPKGERVQREAPIHASNVAIVCGECGKRTRIGSKRLEDGRKVRICRKCEGQLDK